MFRHPDICLDMLKFLLYVRHVYIFPYLSNREKLFLKYSIIFEIKLVLKSLYLKNNFFIENQIYLFSLNKNFIISEIKSPEF